MIPALEALERLREGNRRFVTTRRNGRRAGESRPAQRGGRGPGAVRDHPGLLRLARAGRDRLRPGARRPVRHPGRRQHRGALAGRQRRVRRRALRHPPGGGAGPLAVRRGAGDAGGAEHAGRETSRSATCARSSTGCARRWSPCSRTGLVGTEELVREAVRANVRVSANHLRHGSEHPRGADPDGTACSWWAPSTRWNGRGRFLRRCCVKSLALGKAP